MHYVYLHDSNAKADCVNAFAEKIPSWRGDSEFSLYALIHVDILCVLEDLFWLEESCDFFLRSTYRIRCMHQVKINCTTMISTYSTWFCLLRISRSTDLTNFSDSGNSLENNSEDWSIRHIFHYHREEWLISNVRIMLGTYVLIHLNKLHCYNLETLSFKSIQDVSYYSPSYCIGLHQYQSLLNIITHKRGFKASCANYIVCDHISK